MCQWRAQRGDDYKTCPEGALGLGGKQLVYMPKYQTYDESGLGGEYRGLPGGGGFELILKKENLLGWLRHSWQRTPDKLS